MYATAMIFGLLGIVLNLLIYQQKNSKNVLIFKLLSDIVWAGHYFLLGAYSGLCIACIGIFREIVFIKVNKKSRAGVLWLIIFCLASVISTVFTWKTIASLLPAVASLLSVVSFFFAIPKLARYMALPISLCMGTYDVFVGSAVGIVNEALTIISAIIGIIRLKDRSKKNLKEKRG